MAPIWGLNLHIRHEKAEAEKREKKQEKKQEKKIKRNNKIT